MREGKNFAEEADAAADARRNAVGNEPGVQVHDRNRRLARSGRAKKEEDALARPHAELDRADRVRRRERMLDCDAAWATSQTCTQPR